MTSLSHRPAPPDDAKAAMLLNLIESPSLLLVAHFLRTFQRERRIGSNRYNHSKHSSFKDFDKVLQTENDSIDDGNL